VRRDAAEHALNVISESRVYRLSSRLMLQKKALSMTVTVTNSRLPRRARSC
jgi:hypothetical protein